MIIARGLLSFSHIIINKIVEEILNASFGRNIWYLRSDHVANLVPDLLLKLFAFMANNKISIPRPNESQQFEQQGAPSSSQEESDEDDEETYGASLS